MTKKEEQASRTNRELEELSKGENIVKWIKGQRISWLGQLERMGEDRKPKKIFTQELDGTRGRGGTRKGWREEVERDLQVLGVRRWRELVIDRSKWRGIVRQAKAHSGPQRQRKKTSTLPKNCAFLCYYAASSGYFVPTFHDNLSVPSSRVINPKRILTLNP